MLGERFLIANQVFVVDLRFFLVSVNHFYGVTREPFPLDVTVGKSKFWKHGLFADNSFDSIATKDRGHMLAGIEVALERLYN